MNHTQFSEKSTLDEIRSRFDQDVERFSQLETGQQAVIDSPLTLDLVAQNAKTHLSAGATLLDLGCGAGNFTMRVLQEVPGLHCHLVDLSLPMLDRAQARLAKVNAASVKTTQSDLRVLNLLNESVDAILAGAVLHHLRDVADWQAVFAKMHSWLKPGGKLYVADMILFDDKAVQANMWQRYGDYLVKIGGDPYREKVFAYIDQEDSPRSLPFQIALAQRTGFLEWDVLHRNSVFACYYATK